jgi:hypothetical protein
MIPGPAGSHESGPQLLPWPRDALNLRFTPFPTMELIDRGNGHSRAALPLAGEQTA